MKKTMRVAILFCAALLLTAKSSLAEPEKGLRFVQSPNQRWIIRISNTSHEFVRRISIFERERELAHYNFEGELISVYWSPSGKYVAINNHNGHVGWYPWIFSLGDGAIITASGKVRASNYNRYSDNDYTPDAVELAESKLAAIYPNFKDDSIKERYRSIACKWKTANQLEMFYIAGFERLYERQDAEIWIRSVFEVSEVGIAARDITANKVAGKWWTKYPNAVRKTLDLIPTIR